MGLFGGSRAKKLGDAIGIGDYREEMMAADPSYMPPKKPGFNDPGGLGGKLGEFGDFMLALGGNPVGMAGLQQRAMQQRAELENQQWQQRMEMQDQLIRSRQQPRYFEANNGDQYVIGPDGKPQLVFQDPTPKTTWQAVDNGDGTKTLMPFVNGQPVMPGGMSQGAPGSGGIPQAPVGRLRPYGGASQPGSRRFP